MVTSSSMECIQAAVAACLDSCSLSHVFVQPSGHEGKLLCNAGCSRFIRWDLEATDVVNTECFGIWCIAAPCKC